MADVTVDSTIHTNSARGSRAVVFTTDQIGYAFYIDSDQVFGYSKTSDGGATWGGQVDMGTGGTVQAFDVWYDRWTSGDTGTLIHCWWFDTTNDTVYWRTLDTSGDTLGTQRNVFVGATSLAGRGDFVSGTKTTTGYLYCAYDIDAGTEKGFHRSTDSGTTWSASLSATFVEATLDTCLLFPAHGTGDGNDCWAVYYDASATALTLKLWDSSAVSATESATIQTHTDGATDLTGQYGFSASVRWSDGHLILAAVSLRDNASSTHQVFDITSTSSFATKTAITTNIDDHYWPQVYINQNNDHLYVAYNGKRDGSETLDTTTKVYYTKSTDGGTSWSAGDTAYMEGSAAAVQQLWAPITGPRFGMMWRVTSGLSFNKVNSLALTQTLSGATIASGSSLNAAHTVYADQPVTGTTIAAGSSLQSAHTVALAAQPVTGTTIASGSSLTGGEAILGPAPQAVSQTDGLVSGGTLYLDDLTNFSIAEYGEFPPGFDYSFYQVFETPAPFNAVEILISSTSALSDRIYLDLYAGDDPPGAGPPWSAPLVVGSSWTGADLATGSLDTYRWRRFPLVSRVTPSGATLYHWRLYQTTDTVAARVARTPAGFPIAAGASWSHITDGGWDDSVATFYMRLVDQSITGGALTYTLSGATIASTASLFAGTVALQQQYVGGATLASEAQLFAGTLLVESLIVGTPIASGAALFGGTVAPDLPVSGARIASTATLYGGAAIYDRLVTGTTIASTVVLYGGWAYIAGADLPIAGATIPAGSIFAGAVSPEINGETIASTVVLYAGVVTIDAAELLGAFIPVGSVLYGGSVSVVLEDGELACAGALPIDSDLQF